MTETFEFTLLFKLADSDGDAEALLDKLFEAGCDDALIGVGRVGYIALEFDREAPDAESAMSSAIDAVQKAIPGAELTEVKPDMVGTTEVADIAGCTRQNVRLHIIGKKNVPAPIHSGASDLWHLADLIPFLCDHTPLKIRESYQGISIIAMKRNLAIQERRAQKLLSA